MGNNQSGHMPAPSVTTCPAQQPGETEQQSRCPVPEKYRNPAVYNVYGQRINDPQSQATANPLSSVGGADLLDPKNNMPLEPNQQPCPGQRKPLSVDRMQSTIPKGGTDNTWLYPSPQMFYNGEAPAFLLSMTSAA